MKPLTIIKTGSSLPHLVEAYGDFDHWISHYLQATPDSITIIDARTCPALPKPDACSGVIITGSHDMVTDRLPWSETLAKWIPDLIDRQIPLLGICYGHQLIAHAMGGIVGFHPLGPEIGTVTVSLTLEGKKDPLLASLPGSFRAHASHAQTVLTLPRDASILAANDVEPHHAFRIGPCAWGVQFHPEFPAHVMRAYILEQTDALKRQGKTASALAEDVQETPDSHSVLKHFADIVSALVPPNSETYSHNPDSCAKGGTRHCR
ncbi:MAG: glutamine amidotransferase [Pseudomonadota bacterium]